MQEKICLNPLGFTPHQERAIAVEAGVDPRTVRSFCQRKAIRSTVASRVERAIKKLGIAVPSASGGAA